MKVHEFVARSPMPVPSLVLFEWHAQPGALERLLPPWQNVRVIMRSGGIEDGGRVVLSLGAGPVRFRYVAEHLDYVEGESFRDVQGRGPFAFWEHTHTIEPAAGGTSILQDHIRYALPLGVIGDRVGRRRLHAELQRMFAFRHERTRLDVIAHERYANDGLMRILISGARGLIGSELSAFLMTGGNRVVELTRRNVGSEGVEWSPDEGRIEIDKLATGFDAVVHLAGEPVFGRWTEDKKKRIRESREKGTRLLAESLAALPAEQRPQVMVCASAIGYYGDRGDEILTEDSLPGSGFLAEVCREWEEACEPARGAGIRVVNVRIGLVLSPKGGMLKLLLPVFKAGLGGKVAGGDQWMSWIAIDDLVDIIHAAIMEDSLEGAVNATAPNPVTNAEFTQTLGRVLKRPTLLPVPAFGVKTLLGSNTADETALVSQRVIPARLQERNHPFRYVELEPALRFLLGR